MMTRFEEDILSEVWKTDDAIEKENNTEETTEDGFPVSVTVSTNMTNVVTEDKLRAVQKKVLFDTKTYLAKTFGPMGSNTKIIKGSNKDNITSSYSKDGLKVLSSLSNSGPIEASIVEEIVELTRHVEKEVGDGTTSTVILSSIMFDQLVNLQKKYNVPPYALINEFKEIANKVKKSIKDKGKECTVDDIYNIAMISTNGNTVVAQDLHDIYERYGMDVDINVGISNDSQTKISVYDGLTITEGYSDPVFINNKKDNTSEIPNAHIYHFVDPIDQMDQIALFESILNHNIYEPFQNNEAAIPTVITCPKISRDLSTTLTMLSEQLYTFDQQGASATKPPICIITNVVSADEEIMDDIAKICGCRSIHKYINPDKLHQDQAEGKAPTVDNVWEFYGEAEKVVADGKKTKFINPKHMFKLDENDNRVEDDIYKAMVNYLETEIENVKSTESANTVGNLKRRLASLKANMVDYLIGGVTVSDRDALKDLVEDAVKNCRSAAAEGVGLAANFEGLRASYTIWNNHKDEENLASDIAWSIFYAYFNISRILYGTVCYNTEDVDHAICDSIYHEAPFNIANGNIPENVDKKIECSIMLDINIIDTLSKIISMMVTCNQCLVQAPQLNKY